jgi:lysophospholipase L1-like esterase
VFIGLGGNDFEHPEVRDAPDLGAFKAKYHELVTLVRGKYPKAQIICSVAASLNDTYPPGWNAFTSLSSTLKELVDERHGAPFSDANVHYFELPRAKSSGPGPEGSPDLSACEYHSNAAFHQKIADQAVAKIKTITSW